MMKSRSSHVRTKVVALLASLIALWGFAAFVTLREGLNLLSVTTLDQNVGRPSESLVDALQQERRLSVVYLAIRGTDQRFAMTAQRARTDEASKAFRKLAGSSDTQSAASGALEQRIQDVFGQLDGLGRARDAIDAGSVDRAQAATTFTDVITAAFRIYGALSALDDQEIAKEGRTLIALSRAREILAQEDALIAGVLAAGRFAGDEQERFVQLAGAQRLLYDDAAVELPAVDRDRYQQFVAGPTFARFRAQESLLIERGRVGAPLPVDAQTWKSAVEPVFSELRDLVLKAADGTVKRATPAVVGVIIRLALAGGLGLIAVVASIIISITTARSLVSQLEKLRDAAWELANERLPTVVDRLRKGEPVDIAAEAPPLTFGSSDIGRVGRAFNAVQETAIRVAVEQAELRRGVRDVFLSLARRTQTLVHRQLTMLDELERRDNEPEDLAALFRLDHLATRMRRNAENLIVLSGAVPGRGWRRPVPLVDVVRGAVAEIEDYERVTVLPMGPAALTGRVVGDVIHLLAELIENATSFSPSGTPVQVGGQKVANGFVLEIEDRGLGMTESDLALANEQLRHPPEFKLSSTARLGLYVVGRLAVRHGIRVQLKDSAYGGTLAIVLIPSDLMTDDGDGLVPSALAKAAARPAVLESITAVPPAGPGHGLDKAPDPGSDGSEPDAVREPVASAEPVAVAAPGTPPRPVTVVEHTTNGLPRRVRQTSLAPLQQDTEATSEPVDGVARRPPEEIRRMLSSYQKQTRSGRADSERPPEAYPAATPAEPASLVPQAESVAAHPLVASAKPSSSSGDDHQEEDR
jgi:signal transduction histidine kinase